MAYQLKNWDICILLFYPILKLPSLFINKFQKTLKWLAYILIGHCSSLSPRFIMLDKNNFVKVSYHYLTSGGYQVCLYRMPYADSLACTG